MLADQQQAVPTITEGNIAVAVGLKHVGYTEVWYIIFTYEPTWATTCEHQHERENISELVNMVMRIGESEFGGFAKHWTLPSRLLLVIL